MANEMMTQGDYMEPDEGGGESSNYLALGSSSSAQQSTSVSSSRNNDQVNQRFSNLIHDSEVFLTKLREFKPQSLGCLEARRKSSSTLIFPSPQQACMGSPKCPQYPHNVKPTPGYWIECHGPGMFAVSANNPSGGPVKLSGHTVTSNQEHIAISSTHIRSSHDESSKESHGLRSSPFSVISERPQMGSSAASLSTSPTMIGGEQLGGTHHVRESEKTMMTMMKSEDDEVRTIIVRDISRRRKSLSDSEQVVSCSPCDEDDQVRSQTTSGQDSSLPNKEATNLDQPASQQVKSSASSTTSTFVINYHQQTGSGGGSNLINTERKDTTKQLINNERKKLRKRTMTRDDIDLHKTRRGTPNITITEPSFNQSTTTSSLQQMRRIGSIRQASQVAKHTSGHVLARVDSSEYCSTKQVEQQQQQQPIKFQIQRYTSIDTQQQPKDDQLPYRREQREYTIERQESSDSTMINEPMIDESTAHTFRSSLQYHRPSIIREDIGDDESNITSNYQQVSSTGTSEHQQQTSSTENKKMFCGLSATTFTKRPYQQNYASSSLDGGAGQTNLDQFKDSGLELISFEEENYEKHYYGREHWNYFTNDELLGPVMLSLKQEVNNQRDHFHVLLRTVSYTLHGTIPASTICADRYDREAIVRELSEIAKLKPPLMLGQLPSTPDELLKLDHIFIKTELKVGVIYIKAGQEESEEAILGNKEESPLFTEFLDLLGDRITLKGFDRYKGGLDTVHNLTGTESVYTMWRNIEIMFHVSTMLPHEENDPQKLQKKRHIGNDIVCVAFVESDDTLFWPGCIKSYFLHTFIAIRTSPKPVKEGEKRKYYVSCVCRNEVQYAFRPYLVEQDEFFKSDYFREWLLVKIVNGERASYSAPKFARMQDRTRSQLLEDIITNLANHLVTGQIPKPYRRGSWRPLGHTRASSPLEDSMKDYFEDYDQLAKDFCNAFCGPSKSVLCDVVFKVKDADGTFKLVHGVRAVLAIRSRTFLEMLYGFAPPGTASTSLQNQTSLRAIEMKALSGESSSSGGGGGKEQESAKNLLTKRGSVGADLSRKSGEKERRQSMLPNLSKSISQKPNYLTVPSAGGGGGGSASSTSGMIKNAFNRLVSGNWSGWSGNIKGYKGESMHIKVDQNKTKVDLNSLAICKEIAKIDAEKLSQREFEIKEFDYETFQQTIEYIHNGQCKLSYETIPGLICAAEHYDLPDLLHACFHHANTHMRLSAAPKMMNALYQNSCFYITAMQLLDAIYEYIDPHGSEFFNRTEYLELYESVFTTLLCRKTLLVSELKKFQAMNEWAKRQVANKQKHKSQVQIQRKQSSSDLLDKQQEQSDKEEHQVDVLTQKQSDNSNQNKEETDHEYWNLMKRLNKDINIKLDKISNEDLVRVVLPTKVFTNDKIFDIMADESRSEY